MNIKKGTAVLAVSLDNRGADQLFIKNLDGSMEWYFIFNDYWILDDDDDETSFINFIKDHFVYITIC